MRASGVLRILALLFTIIATWLFASTYFRNTDMKSVNLRSWLGSYSKPTKAPVIQNKCYNRRHCPSRSFAFKIITGAANVVGPSMCFDDNILMSNVKNNVGPGLNIALINGTTGSLIQTDFFDMYSGDVKYLLNFLKTITEGTLVLVASFDDPASHLNDEARKFFTELGSRYASQLAFRDNWIFIGGKGLKDKTPFEQHLKNNKETNKYEGWPEVLEMEGCIPRKMY